MRLILMAVVTAVMALGTVKQDPPPGNYHSGHFYFQEDQLTNSVDMSPLPLPVLIVSVSRLQYHTPFSMRINRTLQLMPTGSVKLTVNASLASLGTSRMYYVMVVSYLFTQRIANLECYTFNLTAAEPSRDFPIQLKYTNFTYHIWFAIGFSHKDIAQTVEVRTPANTTLKDTYKVLTDLTIVAPLDPSIQWIELEVIIIQFDGPCIRGSKEYKNELASLPGVNMSRLIATYRSNLFYMVGLNTMELDEGSFNYSVERHSIKVVDLSKFKFSVLGANMTCLVEDPAPKALKKVKEMQVKVTLPEPSPAPEGKTTVNTSKTSGVPIEGNPLTSTVLPPPVSIKSASMPQVCLWLILLIMLLTIYNPELPNRMVSASPLTVV